MSAFLAGPSPNDHERASDKMFCGRETAHGPGTGHGASLADHQRLGEQARQTAARLAEADIEDRFRAMDELDRATALPTMRLWFRAESGSLAKGDMGARLVAMRLPVWNVALGNAPALLERLSGIDAAPARMAAE